jgi:hypothetical protein
MEIDQNYNSHCLFNIKPKEAHRVYDFWIHKNNKKESKINYSYYDKIASVKNKFHSYVKRCDSHNNNNSNVSGYELFNKVHKQKSRLTRLRVTERDSKSSNDF